MRTATLDNGIILDGDYKLGETLMTQWGPRKVIATGWRNPYQEIPDMPAFC